MEDEWVAITRIADGKIIEPQPLGANYWLCIFDESSARQLKCDVSLDLLLDRSLRI